MGVYFTKSKHIRKFTSIAIIKPNMMNNQFSHYLSNLCNLDFKMSTINDFNIITNDLGCGTTKLVWVQHVHISSNWDINDQ
jgi:hypothetical protein